MERLVFVLFCVGSIWASPHIRDHPINPINVTTLSSIGPRIFNGSQACKGQFPWQALIDVDNGGLCGGSLISDEWVLTAGHCISGYRRFVVQIGSVFYNSEDPDRATLIPGSVIAHENYDINGIVNDVGLMKLPVCVTLNYNIRPIALASCELEAGSDVIVSGWGGTNANLDSPQILKYAKLRTVTNLACQKSYGTFIQSYMVCATNPTIPDESACQGDSGGPLVSNIDTEPVQVGIVSFVNGQECGLPYPSGFTRVAAFRNWIRDNSGV